MLLSLVYILEKPTENPITPPDPGVKLPPKDAAMYKTQNVKTKPMIAGFMYLYMAALSFLSLCSY